MKPTVRIAQRACEAAKARQAVVVWFDEAGQYAVASYGETKAECSAVKPLCNAIADAIDDGELPSPAGAGRPMSQRERDWRDVMKDREDLSRRAQEAEKKLAAIATLVSIYERQRVDEPDEGWPEGYLHPSQVLQAIGETIGDQCSICRSRHGREVQHACE